MNGSLAGADTSPLHADAMNAKAAARASRRVRTHGGIVDMTRATTPDGFGRFAPSVASLCPSVDRGRTSECRPGHTRLSRAPGNRASPRTRCRAVVTVARRDRSSRRGIAGHRRASPGIAGHRRASPGIAGHRRASPGIAAGHRGGTSRGTSRGITGASRGAPGRGDAVWDMSVSRQPLWDRDGGCRISVARLALCWRMTVANQTTLSGRTTVR